MCILISLSSTSNTTKSSCNLFFFSIFKTNSKTVTIFNAQINVLNHHIVFSGTYYFSIVILQVLLQNNLCQKGQLSSETHRGILKQTQSDHSIILLSKRTFVIGIEGAHHEF